MTGRNREKPAPTAYLTDGTYRLGFIMRQVAKIAEPNRSYVAGFDRHLELKKSKERTRARRIAELVIILKLLGKDAKQATKEDIENVVLAINRGKAAASSQEKTKQTIKQFYKYLLDYPGKRAYPPIVDWIEVVNVHNTKTSDELLSKEEMVALIKACKNSRDKLIIALLSNFGCRVGELLNLKVKDIILTDKEASWISFTGKTGYRECPFYSTSLVFPYVVQYMNEIDGVDRDSPLFITKEGLPMDYRNVIKLLHNLKRWIKAKKRIHPHIFRFSVATILGQYMTESALKQFMGWSMRSQQPATYIKRNKNLLAESVLRATGGTPDSEPMKPKPETKICTKCKNIEAMSNAYCSRCGSSLDTKRIVDEAMSVMSMQQKMEDLQKEMVERTRDIEFLLQQINLKDKDTVKATLARRKG